MGSKRAAPSRQGNGALGLTHQLSLRSNQLPVPLTTQVFRIFTPTFKLSTQWSLPLPQQRALTGILLKRKTALDLLHHHAGLGQAALGAEGAWPFSSLQHPAGSCSPALLLHAHSPLCSAFNISLCTCLPPTISMCSTLQPHRTGPSL